MNDLKKIELHLHLDGSVNPKLLYKLTNSKLEDNAFLKQIQVDNTCNSLDDYLKKFNLPISVMQTKENLELVSYCLTKDLELDNVIYAEIRFCPLLHIKKGLTLEEVIDTVLKGLKRSKIKTNLILCCMRGFKLEENLKIVNIAKKYLHKGVCAINLAGNEAKYPNNLYKDIFDFCLNNNIPYTIHSGEALGKDSINLALDYGTKRLGHGIRIEDDYELIKRIIDNNITLEICPESNLDTKVIDKIENHPINKYYKLGMKVTINTDNRTVSNTSLTKEYERLSKIFNLNKQDFIKMNINSINAAFLSDKEKEELLKELKN